MKFSSKSIKEIAADFEFSNVSFFAQYVKKHLGVTPSEYRNNNFVQEAACKSGENKVQLPETVC